MHTAKQKSKATCENVPRAAIMCEVCVIIVTVEEGELKVDRCTAEISEQLKKIYGCLADVTHYTL
jgi:hypothetical protein